MRKIALSLVLLYVSAVNPALAPPHAQSHAVGDMLTKALNNIEAAGKLDSLYTKTHVPINDIHIDHSQVFITFDKNGETATVNYDPIANKLMRPEIKGEL